MLSAIKHGLQQLNFRLQPTCAVAAMLSPGQWSLALSPLAHRDVSEPPVPEILAYEEEIRPQVEKRLGPRIRPG